MTFLQSLLVVGLATSASFVAAAPKTAPKPTPKKPSFAPPAPLGRPNWAGAGKSAGSPSYPLFSATVPIPVVAQPSFTEIINGTSIQYYESTIEPFQQQVYPNLGKANLVGYNGTSPGPTFMIPRGTETVIRYLNNGNASSSAHLHGSYTHSVWDGWADDEMEIGEFKDYYYPNTESARTMWYHDHADMHTASDAYYGQAGFYILYDPAESSLGLPTGKYDVPLALADKIYQSNGDVAAPSSNPMNFFGDVIEVNGQPWPYMNVEPRKYRFRVCDMALSRAFDLYLVDKSNNAVQFQVIASDSGLFSAPVASKDLTISMGERYEIVIDFSAYKGTNMTLMNGLQIAEIFEYQNTDKVMRFIVGNTVSDSTNNNVPSSLNPNIAWPAQRSTIDHTFNFQMGGASTWTVNGVDFNDPNARVLARPPQGTVEHWQFRHTGGPAIHPVHLHLINMQVISRTGGSRGLLPYEAAGLKDVVMLEPGETVDVLAMYGPWNGMYMFHCHNLVHEDAHMMAAFNTTLLSALGYAFNSTQGFFDPMDPQFRAQPSSPALFASDAVHSTVSALAALGAYQPATALMSAEAAYYATAGYNGDAVSTSTSLPLIGALPTSIVALGSGLAGVVPTSTPTSSVALGSGLAGVTPTPSVDSGSSVPTAALASVSVGLDLGLVSAGVAVVARETGTPFQA